MPASRASLTFESSSTTIKAWARRVWSGITAAPKRRKMQRPSLADRLPLSFFFSPRKRTDGHVPVRALHHLVHALRAQRGTQDPGHGLAGLDVGLDRVQAGDTGLGVLLLANGDGGREKMGVCGQRGVFETAEACCARRAIVLALPRERLGAGACAAGGCVARATARERAVFFLLPSPGLCAHPDDDERPPILVKGEGHGGCGGAVCASSCACACARAAPCVCLWRTRSVWRNAVVKVG